MSLENGLEIGFEDGTGQKFGSREACKSGRIMKAQEIRSTNMNSSKNPHQHHIKQERYADKEKNKADLSS